MGADQSIYVGIFLVCKPKPKPKELHGRQCPNHHKTEETKSFCSECGAKLVTVDFHNLIRWSEIGEESYHNSKFYNTLEWLCNSNPDDILVLNKIKSEFGKYINSKDDSIYEYNVDVAQQQGAFMREYEELITILQQYYLDVHVKWGVLVNWS